MDLSQTLEHWATISSCIDIIEFIVGLLQNETLPAFAVLHLIRESNQLQFSRDRKWQLQIRTLSLVTCKEFLSIAVKDDPHGWGLLGESKQNFEGGKPRSAWDAKRKYT